MGRRRVQGILAIHDNIVKDILDKIDLPFATVETTWFRKGQKHRLRNGKELIIDCEQDVLISSYVDTGDGRQIRISNHEKKNGLPQGYIEYIYNWQTYKLEKQPPKEIWD